MMDPAQLRAAGPVTATERITSLDKLRGIAILGILVMNVYAFAMPFSAYANPLRWGGTDALNMATWFFTHVLFDQKFLSIFAMLFGAGIVLMTGRAEARRQNAAPIYYRRQVWLMIIGALHAYLIWFGDILFTYALVGMLAYLFRNRRPRTLIIVACLLLPVPLAFNYGFSVSLEQGMNEVAEIEALRDRGEALDEEQQTKLDDWEAQRAFMMPTDQDLRDEVDVYRGDYAGIVAYRAPVVLSMQIFIPLAFGIWRVGALMLIGMALMKLDVLSAERSSAFYRRLMLVGYLLGIPLTMYSAVDLSVHRFDALYMMRAGMLANYVGSILVAFGHIGLVMLTIRSGALRGLMERFAAVGRMALTNYLMHSVILTTIFYGYGFGLYGSIPRAWQMAFVAAVILLQLMWSKWWLERYRFGPAEWLWRSATYWKLQPMRVG